MPGPDPTTAGDHFGHSAAVWGERVVGGAWVHAQELHASDPNPTDCAILDCTGNEGIAPPCPCANPGAAGEGCANSTGAGARAGISGSTSLSTADLSLMMDGLPSGQFEIFFSGLNAFAVTFADGLRCAGGALRRSSVLGSGAAGSVSLVDALGAGGLCAGPAELGATRHIQGWYRDPSGPCGGGSNLSNAIAAPLAP